LNKLQQTNRTMKPIWIFSLSLCLFLLAKESGAQPFSLRDVMSCPFATGVVTGTTTDAIAWVQHNNGVRNIFLVKGPVEKPLQLTAYTKDDGQEISELTFFRDDTLLLFVRGSGPNKVGETANPDSNPEGASQAIWMVPANGGEAIRLANGSAPASSPDGSGIVFSGPGGIYQLTINEYGLPDNAGEAMLFSARGNNGGQQWSPDGREVLFASARGDHGFIGIYNAEKAEIRWMAPSVDRDNTPVWSPDGKQVAFIRFPGYKKGELNDITGGTKFSIWVADALTGSAKMIWQSPSDDGGFAQYYPASPLRWTKANRILFYSEHEGWMHIYGMDPDGKALKDLTPGACEAEDSGVSPDGGTLYFSSNCNDIDRRHLYSVPVGGGQPMALTKGEGSEMTPVPLVSGKGLAMQYMAYNVDKTLGYYDFEKKEIRQLSSVAGGAFPRSTLVKPTQVVFKSEDGWDIHGQLFLPPNYKKGEKVPAVIFMHGGPIRQMLLTYHYSTYYSNAYSFNQYLASRGYVVLSVNYRDGIGYGKNFRRAPNQGPRGASEYQDIVAAGKYLQKMAEVNPAKIGLWGGSYGGYLTAMGLARNPELFKAGVDLHGVHDWAFRATDFSPGGGWGISGKEMLDKAYESSPVADLSKWTAPVLLVHGDDDRNVLFQQTTDLTQRLREKGVVVELLVFPDEVHGFLRHESWYRAFEAASSYFDRYLK